MATMLIDKPHIAIPRPPRRTRRPKSKPAKPAAVIVGRKVAPETPEERDDAAAEAAKRLWREMLEENGRGAGLLCAQMKSLILALTMLAMLACAGCAQWANEPCAYCGGGPGPGEGGGH
jgi:hypothetical protein